MKGLGTMTAAASGASSRLAGAEQAAENATPFVPGARVAVSNRYGEGHTEAFVDKARKNGNFTLRGSPQQWRPWKSCYGGDRWSATGGELMDERTLTALKGSIAKWEGIVAGTVKDEGTRNCPLCKVFFNEEGAVDGEYMALCFGCPVSSATGKTTCSGTPYTEFDGEDKLQAQAELDFLRSLLPEGAK